MQSPSLPAGDDAAVLAQIIEKYLGWRDYRAQIKREYEEDDELAKSKLTYIENALRDHMRGIGITSMKVAGNTVYSEDVVKPMCEDWPAYQQFILEQGDIGYLQKRVSEASIKQYMTENGGAVPPGITTSTTREVRVRRANQKED